MFESKRDREQFKTYYERKKKRKHSLFSSFKEAFIFSVVMLLATAIPTGLTFLYADKLGVWWWIILLLYSLFLCVSIYVVYRYREITELRGYFTKEEFNEKFKNELWLIKIMDMFNGRLIN